MQKWWVQVSVVVILAVTAGFIARLRLSDIPDLAVGHSSKPPEVGKPRARAVVYEVDGPESAPATVSYLDPAGTSRPAQVRLPWTFRAVSNGLTFPAGVAVSADGADVTCRVIVDGAVRSVQRGFATVDCQVPVS